MILEQRNPTAIADLKQYYLENDLNISKTFATILKGRGYDSKEKIEKFLNPKFEDIPNPFLFNNMQKTVDLINKYIAENKKIVVYGDYDVDGVCSLSILIKYLSHMKANFNCFVPDRHKDGYGLNKKAIDFLKEEKKAELIITVDCGITSVEEIDYAHNLGIEVVITDHHEPKDILPNTPYIIDAKVKGENYPFKELCGAGVACLLIWALSNKSDFFDACIDLAALATVADLVPLVDANRYIVKRGIDKMRENPSIPIRALCSYAKMNPANISSYTLGFKIAPMINACGRLDSAQQAVLLMVSSNYDSAMQKAEAMYKYNEQRKQIEKNIFDEAVEMIGEEYNEKSIVLWNKNWNTGVIGIVASRLVEKYNVPTIIFGYNSEKNIYQGSGRSIKDINLFEELSKCEDLMEHFGGHTAAAGLSVSVENLTKFKDKFSSLMNEKNITSFEKTKYFDLKVDIGELDKTLVYEFSKFEPTGMGNPKPILLLNDVQMKNIISRGQENQHFSSFVFDKTGKVEAIAFNMKYPENIKYFNILATPILNVFESDERFQISISYFEECYHSQEKLYDETTIYSARVVPQPLSAIGLNPKKEAQFKKVGINTVQDLLNYFPKKYMDFRRPKLVPEIKDKEMCAIVGRINRLKTSNKKVSMVYGLCKDEAGNNFMVCWFNQPYITRMLTEGQTYIFCGQMKIPTSGDSNLPSMTPIFFDRNISKLKKIIPIYKKIPGMSNDFLVQSIESCFDLLTNTDYLTREVVEEFNLLCTYDTLRNLHSPTNDEDITNAQHRKIFDDLFRFNFIMKYKEQGISQESIFRVKTCNIWKSLISSLPYELTPDQKTTIKNIFKGMNSGKKLNALVQGDVGSGKTIVAFFALALMAENGFQSCLIAPTTVLAKQHFEACVDLLQPLGVRIAYLSGTTKAKEKKTILNLLKRGEIDVVIGTHAVIQDSVIFNNLGLVIVDEQHRFGVQQREKLLCNNMKNQPHLITMSATPIPRTLCMAAFGENTEVMNIKTKPMGRKPVITVKMNSNEEIYQFIYKELKAGHQAYIVCPLIDDSASETMAEVESVASVVKSVEEYFYSYPDVKISDISGKMKQEEINAEIERFANKETNILISTTIIEVGVNVPNATVMVIKSSERFGLAQAHQLRGRVGRGNSQSYCILQSNKEDDPKANILCGTCDGFEIAKQDLQLRGPGDFIGTLQTGNDQTTLLMMSEIDLYKQISQLNSRIFANPALYSRYEYIIEDYLTD